jgi:hypothetical protein
MLLTTVVTLTALTSIHAEVTLADVDAYNAAATAHDARVARYENTASSFNSERESFNSAVAYYNSLAEDQRTQFQYDRIARWHRDLSQRLSQLNAELDAINRRADYLEEWYNRLVN